MDVKMLLRKTTNYNADIVLEDLHNNHIEVATCYATFTTGESITKSVILNNPEYYEANKEKVDTLIADFYEEVKKLAEFHNVPLL